MRSKLTGPVLSLLLALLGTGMWLQKCQAGEDVAFAQATGPNSVHSLGTIKGWGEKEDRAKQYALKKAKDKVINYLHQQLPRLEWQPSLAYIRDHFLKKRPERRPDEDRKVDGEDIKCWEWTVEITPLDWKDILRRDRDIRVHARMGLLGKILAGLIILLGVVAGYIRLDDWTKGYYTGWLRLASVSVLAIVGSGLWWLS